jgi:hypothetical protein
MSQAECESSGLSAARTMPPRVETRIDAGHGLSRPGSEEAPTCRIGVDAKTARSEEGGGGSAAQFCSPAEQLRRQADQLAGYLRARQREIDHREAEINAKIARLESALREARLTHSRRRRELEKREAHLAARELEFTRRLERLAAAESAAQRRLAAAEQELACREEEVCRREDSLRQREQELATEASRYAGAVWMWEDDRGRSQAAPPQGRREEALEAKAQTIEAREAECRRLAGERLRALAELEEQRKSIQRRSEEIDRDRAALEKLHARLSRIHQETLEDRAAIQELWARLSGTAEPESLIRLLASIRARLAEHYRLAQEDLAERQAELETQRRRLSEEYEKLVRCKQEIDQQSQRGPAADH